jgi:hypothetical protein
LPARSYLYAPGHLSERLENAFAHGADVGVFDLEDGVPPEQREEARAHVAEALRRRSAWVRINPAGTPEAEADLEAIGGPSGGRKGEVCRQRLPRRRAGQALRRRPGGVPG